VFIRVLPFLSHQPLVRLTSLNFMQFVLNFPLKEHHDDGDGDDVYKQD
jgi:hypothetical protein